MSTGGQAMNVTMTNEVEYWIPFLGGSSKKHTRKFTTDLTMATPIEIAQHYWEVLGWPVFEWPVEFCYRINDGPIYSAVVGLALEPTFTMRSHARQ